MIMQFAVGIRLPLLLRTLGDTGGRTKAIAWQQHCLVWCPGRHQQSSPHDANDKLRWYVPLADGLDAQGGAW